MDLGRLGQHDRCALRGQDIAGHPKCRVGRDARKSVRPAALQPDPQGRCRGGCARHRIDLRQHLADAGLDGVDGRAGATVVLDRQPVKPRGLSQLLLHAGDLHHLAAQTHEQRGPDVRVPGMPGQHPLQRDPPRTAVGHPAARSVGKGHHPVDIRIVGQRALGLQFVGGAADDRRRTVDRRHQRHEVARADLSAVAVIALKLQFPPAMPVKSRPRGRKPGAGGLVAVVIAKGQVVAVNVIARRDVAGGIADDLPVLHHRRPPRDVRAGDLVSGRRHAARGQDGDGVRRIQDQRFSHLRRPARHHAPAGSAHRSGPRGTPHRRAARRERPATGPGTRRPSPPDRRATARPSAGPAGP